MKDSPSVTLYLTDVLTPQAFRAFFAWLVASGVAWGALTKIGLSARHFQAWSDLDMLQFMPLVGTAELLLAAMIVPRASRRLGLVVCAAYQLFWMIVSWRIEDGHHTFRALGLLTLSLMALFFGSDLRSRLVRAYTGIYRRLSLR